LGWLQLTAEIEEASEKAKKLNAERSDLENLTLTVSIVPHSAII
jgi:hypothetical protein